MSDRPRDREAGPVDNSELHRDSSWAILNSAKRCISEPVLTTASVNLPSVSPPVFEDPHSDNTDECGDFETWVCQHPRVSFRGRLETSIFPFLFKGGRETKTGSLGTATKRNSRSTRRWQTHVSPMLPLSCALWMEMFNAVPCFVPGNLERQRNETHSRWQTKYPLRAIQCHTTVSVNSAWKGLPLLGCLRRDVDWLRSQRACANILAQILWVGVSEYVALSLVRENKYVSSAASMLVVGVVDPRVELARLGRYEPARMDIGTRRRNVAC